MADWSTLPSDLLYGIALKLNSIEDFIHFSAVCHSWNNVFSLVKTKWIANNLTTPWLLLPPEPNNINSSQEENPRFDEVHRKILSIGENKCYKLKLPETFGARCWGSAYGWIVMLHLDKRIQLFNPVTKAQLNLPSLQTMPEQPREDELPEDPDEADDWFQKTFLHRFIVLKMPRKDNVVDQDEFVVMAIYWPHDHLAFARPGDQAWTPVSTSCTCKRQVSDVFIWNGLVLILYIDGALAYCDISGTNTCNHDAPIPVKAKGYLPTPNYIFGNVVEGLGELYMVELGGELGVVLREKRDCSHPKIDYYTCGFEVYKLNCHTKLWEKVEELGDYLLFVGNNTPMSIHISDAVNCIRNAIYFTDDEVEFWEMTVTRGHDMGVFDMTSREIKKIYEGIDTNSKCSPPIWFWPKF